MLTYTYMEAIGKGFPGVECHCQGDGSVYEEIIHDGGIAMPSKADIDTWIAADIKTDMWNLIKDERDRRKLEGGYKVGNDWYHSDVTSRIQQIALVMMGANLPAGLYWKTMGGGFVLMTQTLAMQIFMAAATSDATIFAVAEQKKAAMLASATPATYSYLTGWPLIYGE
jgi:hypothetical protein